MADEGALAECATRGMGAIKRVRYERCSGEIWDKNTENEKLLLDIACSNARRRIRPHSDVDALCVVHGVLLIICLSSGCRILFLIITRWYCRICPCVRAELSATDKIVPVHLIISRRSYGLTGNIINLLLYGRLAEACVWSWLISAIGDSKCTMIKIL